MSRPSESAAAAGGPEPLPARRGPDLEVRVDTGAEHIAQLIVAGALDADGVDRLLDAARQALAGFVAVVLDLRRLDLCDAAGVEAVLAVHALAIAEARLLVIRPAARAVHRVFEDTGAADELPFLGHGGMTARRPASPRQRG